jgi:hypothetical protein
MMAILICLGLGYVAAVVAVWFVIAVFWDREWQSGLNAKSK